MIDSMDLVKKHNLKVGDTILTSAFMSDMNVTPDVKCYIYRITESSIKVAHSSIRENYSPEKTTKYSEELKLFPILKNYLYLDYINRLGKARIIKIYTKEAKKILNNIGYEYAKKLHTKIKK